MEKKKPLYTLVNRPEQLTQSWDRTEKAVADGLGSISDEAVARYMSLPDALRRSVSNTFNPESAKATGRQPRRSVADIERVVMKLGSQERSATVGLLDLGAWVTALPALLELMNGVQSRFVFLEVQTPVPAGMVKTKKHLIEWAQAALGSRPDAEDCADLTKNMLADEFFYFAKSLRPVLGLDLLMGLTPWMIAFMDKGRPVWNYYTAGEGEVSLVSTCDLREFSKLADRPYEAAVGMLIAAQVLVSQSSALDYHKESSGCVFDFNDVREDLIESIRSMRIEESCLAKVPEGDRSAANALIDALGRMKEKGHG